MFLAWRKVMATGAAPAPTIDRLGTVEIVAGRADAQACRSRPEPAVAGKLVPAALRIADHRHRDGGAILPGADRHAFHGALLGRGHLRLAQRYGGLRHGGGPLGPRRPRRAAAARRGRSLSNRASDFRWSIPGRANVKLQASNATCCGKCRPRPDPRKAPNRGYPPGCAPPRNELSSRNIKIERIQIAQRIQKCEQVDRRVASSTAEGHGERCERPPR